MLVKGWHVPQDLTCPIDVVVLSDDFHVIVFPDGHPRFEAFEAMIRLTDRSPPIVRVIATFHDQSQIDFTNDPGTRHASATAGRRIFLTDIHAQIYRNDRRIAAQVSFTDEASEKIGLSFVGAGLPDAARSGLSDPGRHSMESSLPIMWRERSTVGTSGSHVDIGGVKFAALPLQHSGPHLTLRRAFMSEGHRMAIVRAGIRSIERGGPYDPNALRLVERLTIPSADGGIEFVIDFDDGLFSCRIGASGRLVSGKAWTEIHQDAVKLALEPDSPSWTMARPVLVTLSDAGGASGYTIVTEIGGRPHRLPGP